jgi:hypothetical protein
VVVMGMCCGTVMCDGIDVWCGSGGWRWWILMARGGDIKRKWKQRLLPKPHALESTLLYYMYSAGIHFYNSLVHP